MIGSRRAVSSVGAFLCVVLLGFTAFHQPVNGAEVDLTAFASNDGGALFRLRTWRITMELLGLFDLFTDCSFVASIIADRGIYNNTHAIPSSSSNDVFVRDLYITVFGHRILGDVLVAISLWALILSIGLFLFRACFVHRHFAWAEVDYNIALLANIFYGCFIGMFASFSRNNVGGLVYIFIIGIPLSFLGMVYLCCGFSFSRVAKVQITAILFFLPALFFFLTTPFVRIFSMVPFPLPISSIFAIVLGMYCALCFNCGCGKVLLMKFWWSGAQHNLDNDRLLNDQARLLSTPLLNLLAISKASAETLQAYDESFLKFFHFWDLILEDIPQTTVAMCILLSSDQDQVSIFAYLSVGSAAIKTALVALYHIVKLGACLAGIFTSIAWAAGTALAAIPGAVDASVENIMAKENTIERESKDKAHVKDVTLHVL